MKELPALRALVAIAREGSFVRAAAKLEVPRSTVSRWIRELEATLGVRVLARSTRAVSLTDAGRLLVERSAGAFAALDEAVRAAGDLARAPRGLVKLSAPPTFAGQLGPALHRALLQHPELRLCVDESAERVDLVGRGVDLALRAGALPDSSLRQRELVRERVRCYAAPAYLARRGTPRAPAALADHDCLLLVDHDPALGEDWAFEGPDGAATVHVRGRFASRSFAQLRDAAVAGLGVARLYSNLAGPAVAAGALAPVLPGHPGPETAIHLVTPAGRRASAALSAVIAAITAAASAPGD